MSNGTQTKVDIAHRLGIWISVIVLGGYVLNMGQWVGAADEKFDDAATVETTQRALLIQVNTIATIQGTQTTAIRDNKDAIEDSRRAILDAIRDSNEN